MYKLIHRSKCNYPLKQATQGKKSILAFTLKKIILFNKHLYSVYNVKDSAVSAEQIFKSHNPHKSC